MMKLHDSLASLLSWWAGYRFEIGEISPAGCPRTFVSRDGRRVVLLGFNTSCQHGDNVRLANGHFVEVGGWVGRTKTLQAWTVQDSGGRA